MECAAGRLAGGNAAAKNNPRGAFGRGACPAHLLKKVDENFWIAPQAEARAATLPQRTTQRARSAAGPAPPTF